MQVRTAYDVPLPSFMRKRAPADARTAETLGNRSRVHRSNEAGGGHIEAEVEPSSPRSIAAMISGRSRRASRMRRHGLLDAHDVAEDLVGERAGVERRGQHRVSRTVDGTGSGLRRWSGGGKLGGEAVYALAY